MDFLELFLELTLLRRMDVLAEKLVPWEPLNDEQRLALLAKRTRPAKGVRPLQEPTHQAIYDAG